MIKYKLPIFRFSDARILEQVMTFVELDRLLWFEKNKFQTPYCQDHQFWKSVYLLIILSIRFHTSKII